MLTLMRDHVAIEHERERRAATEKQRSDAAEREAGEDSGGRSTPATHVGEEDVSCRTHGCVR